MDGGGSDLARDLRDLVGQLDWVDPGKLVLTAERSRVVTVSDRNHTEVGTVARRNVDAQNYWVGKMRRRFTAHCCCLDAVGWDQGCCGGQWEETVDVGARVIGFRPVKVQLLLDRRFVG